MQIDSARDFFAALAARGREPRLANASGSWGFDIEGVGKWTLESDKGALRVTEGAPPANLPGGQATTRLRMKEDELLRLLRGEGHENLQMGLIRGAVTVEGNLAFGQKLQAILPLPEEWRVGP